MPLNETDKAWIRQEINAAVKGPWRKLLDIVPITGLIAIGIFLISQYGTYVEFRTHTNDRLEVLEGKATDILKRLDSIDAALKKAADNSIKQSLISHAAMPALAFKQTLPELRSAVTTASKDKIQVPSGVINGIGEKLAESKDTPDFWPTAAAFISYRSQITVEDYQQLLRPDLPNCVDKPPVPMKVTMDAKSEMALKGDVEANKGTQYVPALYENCRFTLDSPEEVASIPVIGEGHSYLLTFRHCQIIYHGGPITIFTPNPRPTMVTGYGPTRSDVFIIIGQTINFEQCLLMFDIKSRPSTEGQTLTQQLLAQSGQVLTVKFPKNS